MKKLPRTVIALGWVSLLTDLSSEMIYPLLPTFLTAVLGAGAVALGVVEGVAEATASILKVISGFWADRMGRKKPLVLAGYGLSGASRPLIGLATGWLGVLALRFGDRVGKGLRTSPRDALIADTVAPSARGTAFGFHRAMDHGGAVLGPLAAAALLGAGVSLRTIFVLSAVPAAAVMAAIVFGVRERRIEAVPSEARALALGPASPEFLRLLGAVALFTLGNSTDAFLLLRLAGAGISPSHIALLWAAHNGIKMVSTYLGGRLSDNLGRRPLLVGAWAYYAAIYGGFAAFEGPRALVILFLAYGIFFGLSEPTERAWAADLSPSGFRGRTYALYHGTVGLTALPASLLFGLLWKVVGPAAAFAMGAALALAACLLLFAVPSGKTAEAETP